MLMMDTHQVIKNLVAAKVFPKEKAEAFVEVMKTTNDNLATKDDLKATETGLKSEIKALRNETKAEFKAVRNEMEAEFKLVRRDFKNTLYAALLTQTIALTGIMLAGISLLK